MNFGKEKEILEYFPIALYTLAMMIRSGRSLEQGLKFISIRNYGRVSELMNRVLSIANASSLEDGLASIEDESDNRYYREAIRVMGQYARSGSSIGDRLVSLGNQMQTHAVMARRNHLMRVKSSLMVQTGILLGAIPFLLIVIIFVLTSSSMFNDPLLTMDDTEAMVYGWFVILIISYPLLFRSYIIRNPVIGVPRLHDLHDIFGGGLDAPISSFLNDTAQHIRMGVSPEMAVVQSVPYQLSHGLDGDKRLVKRMLLEMSDKKRTFSQSLHAFASIVHNRKFDLTVDFIDIALSNRHASLADTLDLLAESFWTSHITISHFQESATTPALASILIKGFFAFFMASLFPFLAFIFFLFFAIDILLITLALL